MTCLATVFIKYAEYLIIRFNDWLRMIPWVIHVKNQRSRMNMKMGQMIGKISCDMNIGLECCRHHYHSG